MIEPGESFRQTLVEEESAERALYAGDPEPYKALWSRADDVSLFGAFGPCRTGWAELSRVFDWIATRFRGGSVSLDYQVVSQGTDVAYTVAFERGQVPLDHGSMRSHTIRVTQVYRLEDGRWRLVHRHGDFAPVDESPP